MPLRYLRASVQSSVCSGIRGVCNQNSKFAFCQITTIVFLGDLRWVICLISVRSILLSERPSRALTYDQGGKRSVIWPKLFDFSPETNSRKGSNNLAILILSCRKEGDGHYKTGLGKFQGSDGSVFFSLV